MKPYITVPFSFSEEAYSLLNSIVSPLVDYFQNNASEEYGLMPIPKPAIDDIKDSIIWKEVLEFSKKYKLSEPHPQLFIYKHIANPRSVHYGNPHIDTQGPNSDEVPFRFNILLSGDENTEMVWWNIGKNDPRSTIIEYVQPDFTTTKRVQIKGANLIHRLMFLGPPNFKCNTLHKKQEYASFVKTSEFHALNWNGTSPRVVFSLKYQDPWLTLVQYCSTLPNQRS